MAGVTMPLARMLGLRPLDRVQLNNRDAIRDMQLGRQVGCVMDELPYLFFQHVTDDGKLCLRTPTGYAWHAAPEDVCDVIPGEPLLVRAMTTSGFHACIARRVAERGNPHPQEWYAPAYILHVSKDRWKRIDRTCVCFVDEALGEKPGSYRPVHQDDLERVLERARRTQMPVLGDGGNMLSADKGVVTSTRLAAATVSTFFRLALQDDAGSAQLSSAGISRPSHAVLNCLRDRPRQRQAPLPDPAPNGVQGKLF